MTRIVLGGSILRKTLILTGCALLCGWLHSPVAWAQHGGHVGGAHAGGGPLGAAHFSAPPPSHSTVPPPRTFTSSFLGTPANRYFRLTQQPMYIFRHHHGFYGPPYFLFGWGWGFNSLWWQSCNPFWYAGLGCSGYPQYGYGFGVYPTPPYYIAPLYMYGGEDRDLVQLYFNDGSAVSVTDYWIVDGQIHFTTIEEGSRKPVEHIMGFNDLDLQKTVDVNTQRGFRFVLRNEPWQQYLKDHPDTVPPPITPPASAPPEKK
jgi:hypothetical protein